MSKKCYSYDQENFYCDLDYVLDVAKDYDLDGIYVGEKVMAKWKLGSLSITDIIIDNLFAEVGECAQECTDNLRNKIDENELNKVVLDYINKVGGPPRVFLVENVKYKLISELDN